MVVFPSAIIAIEDGGILSICKPKGATSFTVTSLVRRILQQKKVGHCGTLDPMATGVLPVVYGKATALSETIMNRDKVYNAQIQFGIATDSGDITGNILQQAVVPELENSAILAALQSFVGTIKQRTPLYSAAKVGGRKLYEYAREDIAVTQPLRIVTITGIEFLRWESPLLSIRIACSKGTYVRTLAEDIGAKLGCPATLSGLVREQAGGFSIPESIPFEIMAAMNRAELLARALPIPQ